LAETRGINKGLLELKTLLSLATTGHFPYLNELAMNSHPLTSPTEDEMSSRSSGTTPAPPELATSEDIRGRLSPRDTDDDWEFLGDEMRGEEAGRGGELGRQDGLREGEEEEGEADLIEQLGAMGYQEEEARAATRAVGPDLDLALDYLQSPRRSGSSPD